VLRSCTYAWVRFHLVWAGALFFCLLGVVGTRAVAQPIQVIDDTGQSVAVATPAQRIVSLAPHVTENLFAAGVGDRVVAAVDYSDTPPDAAQLPRVGGYSRLDLERILAFQPDLVVAWASGNPADVVARIEALGIPVYRSQPNRLDDIAKTLRNLAYLAGNPAAGERAAQAFLARRDALAARYAGRAPVRVFYQIWDRPLRTIGGQQILTDVMRLCGGVNVFGALDALAPTVSVEAVLAADPEVIVASGMGEERPDWLDAWRAWPQLTAVRADNLVFIPPALLQRPTPRLLDGAEQLCTALEAARSHLAALRHEAASEGMK